jgi:hypothetical protein
MSQRNPGSPEDAVVNWLNDRWEVVEAAFFALMRPVVQHPYFAVAILAVVVYLAVAARKGKGRR